MLTVAFLANELPSPVETYVVDQLEELRRRGVRVVAGSVRQIANEVRGPHGTPNVVLQPLRCRVIARAAWLCLRRWKRIAPLVDRVAVQGNEGPSRRMKALAHTFLGACYAAMLERRSVEHIHVHHGYFGSWVAMVAARLLDIPFSMTLYGSDLLLHGAYLDTKLERCAFCLTISEFNLQYILKHYPKVKPEKLAVVRLGVDVLEREGAAVERTKDAPLILLAVGRLHPVKNHAFLVQACSELLARSVNFQCFIVGEGSERAHLESMIARSGLIRHVHLLGYVSQEKRDSLYDEADIVVLTSRSEGIPVVLMEAMSRGKVVLAPAVTGIPELVVEGKTGFLYEPGVIDDFVAHILLVQSLMQVENDPSQRQPPTSLDRIRHAAKVHVRQNFERRKNLELFGDAFLQRVGRTEGIPDENPILQQI